MDEQAPQSNTPAPEQNAPQRPATKPKKRSLVSRFLVTQEPVRPIDDGIPENITATWNAPEFIYTHKPFGWYIALALFFAILIGVAVLTQYWFSIALFAVMGIAVGVWGARKPRILNYAITNHGVHVGEKRYGYEQFTSYFEADDYGQLVFELVPNQRFAPLVSMPAPNESEAQIEAELAKILPKSPPREGMIEKIFKALRF